ncbi:MAG: hypothetical protein KatS3mg053_2908 [Candidatus Roseilinea sp.]|nr:MAG: hypothetical protein KatS3mg053_2908 [Candidatus Roseilinea sp.]
MTNTALTRLGALTLALSLIGYAVYELALLPAAGFPSDDMRVILTGADTLRVGHWLKFGYGLALALVVAGMTVQLREAPPALTQLALMAGIAAVALYIASGMLGLRLLEAAQSFYPTNPTDARSTILIRIVTQSLQAAGTFAVGWFAVLISIAAWQARALPRWMSALGVAAGALLAFVFILPDPIWLIGPLLTIIYAVALAIVPARAPVTTPALA